MPNLNAAVIGCGRPRRESGATGFGIAHPHAAGYKAHPNVSLVAVADINRENGEAFAQEHGVPNVYDSHEEMLEKESIDVVSVCLWTGLHAPIVTDVAARGVRAIHCEKPMAPTFGEAKAMVEACGKHGVQLTFNHQRRFLPVFRKAKELAHSGVIGEVRRLEGFCIDIFDWGTHWIDMMCFYNNEADIEWVIGQIDSREERIVFGVPVENQAIVDIQWKNGVHGFLETGTDDRGCANRILGTDGIIEVGVSGGPALRFIGKDTAGWQTVDVEGGIHGRDPFTDSIAHAVDCLKEGREPETSGRNALRTTETIFAAYESSRRRARVDLPLDVDDSPFIDMYEKGTVGPKKEELRTQNSE
jgi:UDP-N-acetylglucosamine 3-dehydrogenase